jgi:FSR family fosmidomycin resistance protein-like MFS transporter
MSTNIAENVDVSRLPHEKFQPGQVLPIAGAHFIHDTYPSFVPPLLPVLIEKFSLSLTQAGFLTAIMQIPAVLNPFIGYLADKTNLRYFVILTPAITGTLISSMGFAPDFFALAVILFAAGASTAAFHAPAPAMISRASGRKIGLGMSLFMAAGELSRTVGPLLAVWAVSTWTLDGLYRTAVIGWAASLVLYFRLRDVPASLEKPGSIRSVLPVLRKLFLPLAFINFFNDFLLACMTTFLPTYMQLQGANLFVAGGALSILSLAGAVGALTSGTISDRLGRKQVLFAATISSVALMLVFLKAQGWLLIPILLMIGFTSLATGPVMLAMVQENLPNNRSVGNGIYMFISFLVRPIATVIIGAMGDLLGLKAAFFWSSLVSLLSIPVILTLPGRFRSK